MTALAAPSSKLVLVVDDDDSMREFFEIVLRNAGYQVEMAANGNEAMQKVRQKTPDLILTDLIMPESGGYEVLRGIRAEGEYNVPIVVCTARRLDKSTEEMIRSEGNVKEFLYKPLSMPVLLRVVSEILQTHPPQGTDIPSS